MECCTLTLSADCTKLTAPYPGIPLDVLYDEAFLKLWELEYGNVLKAPEKICLSPELLERLSLHCRPDNTFVSNTRILRCSLDNRSQIWLTPEAKSAKENAALIFLVIPHRGRAHVTVTGTVPGLQTLATATSDNYGSNQTTTILASVPFGSKVTIHWEKTVFGMKVKKELFRTEWPLVASDGYVRLIHRAHDRNVAPQPT